MSNTEKRNPRTTHFSSETTLDMVKIINEENMNSVLAVGEALPDIAKAIDAVAEAFTLGGRLIYVGAGTSGDVAYGARDSALVFLTSHGYQATFGRFIGFF